MFDLLIKGGRVIDPSQGIDDERDLALTRDRVAALEKSIPESQAHHYQPTDGRLRDRETLALDPEHERDTRAFAQATVEALRASVFPLHGL